MFPPPWVWGPSPSGSPPGAISTTTAGPISTPTATSTATREGRGSRFSRTCPPGTSTVTPARASGATSTTTGSWTSTGEGVQNELTMHFGLGAHGSDVTVEVRWPDGTV
ncbi:MAG: hypothetical protein CMJ18_10070 [Phycisphaeraceae bacterium]|nr:hypothetical protein [Phycisphaeraceae bacterium]